MSGSTAKSTIVETHVETVTSVTVEEKVATLEVTESSTPSSPASPSKASTKASGAIEPHHHSLHRDLPIFSNPLLANATRANSVPIKPKVGRIKAGGKTVAVLRISAPKVDGEVVVMRRLDSDLVNATSMFNAAYPAISEKMDAKESSFITRKYQGVVEKFGALSGVWITVPQAMELAKEYEIDQFMRPLLDQSSIKSAAVKEAAIDGDELSERSFVSEVTIVHKSSHKECEVMQQATEGVEEATEELHDLTVADVVKMKRRIEELEDQASRDKKKFRSLVTVAVGLAAASVIPQKGMDTVIEAANYNPQTVMSSVQGHPGTFVVCTYFVAWAIYARNHNVFDLPVQNLTHVLYAFANLDAEGRVVLGDPWADTDKHYEDDSWNDTGKNLYGNFKRLGLLKKANRHLKVSLSIGGWTWSTNFAGVASSPEKRSTFVKTSINLMNNLGLDGLDIDWEYPKTPEDAVNYVSLLRELRQGLDQYAAEKGDPNPYLLTGAMPCGETQYSLLRLNEMNQYMDAFYLMAYDLAGSWSDVAGHQSNLHGGKISVSKAVQHYKEQGIPSHKLIVGMPIYGRAFQNTNGIGHSFEGIGPGTWEQGVYDFKHLPMAGAVEYYDAESVSSYSYDPVKRELITYDTPLVIDRKAEYIAHNGLGGAMFWESSSDHKGEDDRSLIGSVTKGLRRHAPLDSTLNHLSYPSSEYDNVRAGFE
ncbi:hypothetical protein BGZ75_003925 [Mortierella antarctica]|nr:hypothetical protein BGZ75_003925 [Mortierella antarctica]